MTRAQALSLGTAKLRAAGIEQPRREARLLLAHALGIDQERLLTDLGAEVEAGLSLQATPGHDGEGTEGTKNPPGNTSLFSYLRLLERRAAHEPLAFILGSREFWSLSFEVSPDTLVPRPESETLIEAALAAFPDHSAKLRVLDLGTGTGCLLLAALSEFPAAFGVGVDRAPSAVALARRNAARLGLADRSAFVCAEWGESLGGAFDLILCNPPYIPSDSIPGLMAEVAGHEPLSALDGGPDGLAAYRTLLPRLPGLLRPAGVVILELGIGQAELVAALAASAGLPISAVADLAGIPRAFVLGRTLPKNRWQQRVGGSSFLRVGYGSE